MKNEAKKLTEKVYLDALVGKKVALTFLDGEVMGAVYVASDRYQLFFKDGDRVYMVFKHALRSIVPANSDDD